MTGGVPRFDAVGVGFWTSRHHSGSATLDPLEIASFGLIVGYRVPRSIGAREPSRAL